ncbi:hypothetical protein LCGC14_1622540, partial [marine sediment metagenome]
RIPMRQIYNASKRACILFFDEITTAPQQVQAALLRGIHGERVFGDVKLHPETVIVAAANPPNQAPGGHDMAAPLIGRFAVYDFCSTLPEVQAYFEAIEESGSTLCTLALDLSATSEHMPELFQLHPPQAAVIEGALWASPRDWERGLRVWAAAIDYGTSVDDNLAYKILAGSVGEHAASAYTAIRKLRVHLPTIQDIIDNPHEALVPSKPDYQIGALGLLANVATVDCWAAWIYTMRLDDEIAAAVGRAILRRKVGGAKKHVVPGRRARAMLLGKIGLDLGA